LEIASKLDIFYKRNICCRPYSACSIQHGRPAIFQIPRVLVST